MALPAILAAAIAPVFAQELTPDNVAIRPGDGKTVLTFSTAAAGTWTVPAGVTSVEVLVVGGGGGGAIWAGGSGGGGMYFTETYTVTPETSMLLSVGAGGIASTSGEGNGGDGQPTQFGNLLIAYGGIHGMRYSDAGGGNQGGYTLDGGTTIVPGMAPAEPRSFPWWSGSGAGAPGTVGDSAPGGIGAPCSITGTETYYAGGGGSNANGAGGLGGGGSGPTTFGGPSFPGQNGKGGGAGGGWGGTGANGGSGVVIIAFESAATLWTVSFDSNEGSAVSSLLVVDGTAATPPSNPTRTGYTFNGWFTDEALTLSYDFQTLVTENITLYAKWTINSYTLTYTPGLNGTVTGDSPQTVQHGASGTQVTAVPDSGYLFLKWSDESLTNPRTDTNVTGNITVSAIFAEIPPPFSPDTVAIRGDGKTVATFSTVGSGTWIIPAGVSSVEVLVVGGGGGGGNVTGGGGAGGLYSSEAFAVTPGGGVIINVGDGGAGGAAGANGQNSSFDSLIAFGGVAGGNTGGSSGGNNQGGTGFAGGANQGGGGGAGQAGQDNWFAAPNNNGGNGLQDDITGALTYYGGGGSTYYNGSLGGLGGGGSTLDDNNGGIANPNGVDGLGGGGASGRNINGGGGGSGVVIVAYSLPTTLTTVELDSDVNPSVEGASVTFTATVKVEGLTETAATGTFEFKVDDVVVEAAAAIVDGVATYTTSSLAVGDRSVTATYSGDSTYGSSFASMTQTVEAAAGDAYDEWAGASGFNLVGGRADDDDGDGVSNFDEFAFGLDPTSGASSNPIVDISQLKSDGIFSYTKHSTSTLEYLVYTSDDLQGWNGPIDHSAEPGEPDANGVVTVVVSLAALPTGESFFLRVKASEAAPQPPAQ